ncbi:MAG: T9SS type A sorting domain-containing protein, partial [Bacteroidota bacterium]
TLEGLSQLEIIGQSLRLEDNPKLENIEALRGVQRLGMTYHPLIAHLIYIKDNSRLSDCCIVKELMEALPPGGVGRVLFQNNAKACSSISAIYEGCGQPKIQAVSLINAHSGEILQRLSDTFITLDAAELDSIPLSARVELVDGQSFNGSVFFRLNGPNSHRHTENQVPYEMYGDNQGTLLEPGRYTLEVFVYSNKWKNGTIYDSQTFKFFISDPHPRITGFTLVNPFTNEDIGPLLDGDQLDLARLPSRVNIRANTEPAEIGSVVFKLDNSTWEYKETIPPYALFGNSTQFPNSYLGGRFSVREYTMQATPFTRFFGKGEAGERVEIRFEVIDSEALKIYPNPSTGVVNLESQEAVTVQLFDGQGRFMFSQNLLPQQVYQINLAPGLYQLRWQSRGLSYQEKILVE